MWLEYLTFGARINIVCFFIRGEIFQLFTGPKSWFYLTPPRPGQLGIGSAEDLIRLNSTELKNLASGAESQSRPKAIY